VSAAKPPQEIPPSSGVYQIRCRRNGKIYVGSAANFRARWRLHYRNLCRGVHHNSHLQSAWNRYGERGFEFVVLEFVALPGLLIAEQKWIERTDCTNHRIGFNIRSQATSPGEGIGQTWAGFRDPEGKPVTIVNLSDFCRRNRLDFPSMHRLSKGKSKLKSYKGWTHTSSVRQREYIKTHRDYVGPDGQPAAPIRNLSAFCLGLEASHMVALAGGRLVSHRGWTHLHSKKRLAPLVHKGFIAPGGARTRITNLSAFCSACGLSPVHMYQLKSGKRPRHKGWTWKHDADHAFE
jgi:group I intron endonuclease